MIEIIPNWHPIFVHFTVALITVSGLLFIILKISGIEIFKGEIFSVARWTLWIGAVFTVVTFILGFVAYYSVAHDLPSHKAMIDHRNWAIATFSIIILCAIWSLLSYLQVCKISNLFLIIVILMLLLLASTAWHGAELVYRYGLGVMSLPQVHDNDEESHVHKNINKSVPNGHEGHDHSH